MIPSQRLEVLRDALERLRHANGSQWVLVEGPRDVRALRSLGLGGTIVHLQNPRRLLDEADHLATQTTEIILFTDWDRTGGSIARTLRKNLAGRVRVDLEHRRRIASVVGVRCVEDLPAFLDALTHQAGQPGRS